MVITREHTLAGNRFAALACSSSEDEQQVPETYQFRPIGHAQTVPSMETVEIPDEPKLEVIDLTGGDDEEPSSGDSVSDELITDEELEPSPSRKRSRYDVEEDDEDDALMQGHYAHAEVIKFAEQSRKDNVVFSDPQRTTRHAHYYARWHQAKQLKKAGNMLMQLYELPVLTEDALFAEARLLEFIYDRVFDIQN